MSGGHSFASLGLTELARRGVAAPETTAVGGLAVDSRTVGAGDLFVAVPGAARDGTALDGAAFAREAVLRGAVGVVATAQGVETARAALGDLPVPFFVSPNPRAELSRLAARYYVRQPAVTAAVTGTNGKTSTAHFLRQIWAFAGHRAAALGTLGVDFGDGEKDPLEEGLAHTTPEPVTLHRLLARLAAEGCTHAVMEASSHGLAQHRLDGVRPAAAGLTNIARDHMDYHGDHADYAAAKMRLFDAVLPESGVMVVNAEDAEWPRLRAVAQRRGIAAIAVGTGADADLQISTSRVRAGGREARFVWKGRTHSITLNLIGGFQVENAAIAAGMALATGEAAETVFAALPRLTGARGRMELAARRANGAAIYVDYAHTPDALRSAIAALRPHCPGRLTVVFGAGGERDAGKRPLMGRAAAEGADGAIVTDDNPRGEDPAEIRAAIGAACPGSRDIGDRAEAIFAGVEGLCAAGDCLLIAGKGHERGQILGETALPFDDAERARAAVRALDGARGP